MNAKWRSLVAFCPCVVSMWQGIIVRGCKTSSQVLNSAVFGLSFLALVSASFSVHILLSGSRLDVFTSVWCVWMRLGVFRFPHKLGACGWKAASHPGRGIELELCHKDCGATASERFRNQAWEIRWTTALGLVTRLSFEQCELYFWCCCPNHLTPFSGNAWMPGRGKRGTASGSGRGGKVNWTSRRQPQIW